MILETQAIADRRDLRDQLSQGFYVIFKKRHSEMRDITVRRPIAKSTLEPRAPDFPRTI